MERLPPPSLPNAVFLNTPYPSPRPRLFSLRRRSGGSASSGPPHAHAAQCYRHHHGHATVRARREPASNALPADRWSFGVIKARVNRV